MVQRVRVFCDFWNFQLACREYDPQFALDWKKLSSLLVREAGGDQGSYEGSYVYASIDPRDDNTRLRGWLENTLNRLPGYQVRVFERKAARVPHCPECNQDIATCPRCGAPLKRSIEKGVDTALVTDMLQHAWTNTYDIGILLSSDRDYVPAVKFLDGAGKKIIHASFTPNAGRELASACWDRIDLSRFAAELRRP